MSSIAVLAPALTYTHLAALQYFGRQVDFEFHAQPADVCRAVETGRVASGVIAVENSSAGFVDNAFDAFYRTKDIVVRDEIYMPIRHSLLSQATSLGDVTAVYSHPQAFAQCASNLKEMFGQKYSSMIRAVASTAQGAEIAATDPNAAAIASDEAGRSFGLNVLRQDLQDRASNTTRFFVVQKGAPPERHGSDRSLFLVELRNETGTLQSLLELFSGYGIALHYLYPRPKPGPSGPLWEYTFFVEFGAHIHEPRMALAYEALKRRTFLLRTPRFLGSFPNRLPASVATSLEGSTA